LIARILLASLLSPEQFGLFGIIVVGMGVLTSVADLGLQSALLRRRGARNQRAASSVFWVLGGAGLAIGVIWAVLGAPLLGWAYGDSRLVAPAQVMGAMLFLVAVSAVPGAVLIRKRGFGRLALAEFSGVAAGTAAALALAEHGAGIWSLVAQQVLGSLVTGLLTVCLAQWRPSLCWDTSALQELWPFGRAMAATRVVMFARTNSDQFFVGAILGPAALGIYLLAFAFTEGMRAQAAQAMARVLLPQYGRRQSDLASLRTDHLRTTRLTTLVFAPFAAGVALYAEPLCLNLLGEAWRGAAGPMRVLALAGLLHAAGGPAAEVLQGLGRAQQLLGIATRQLLAVGLPLMALLTWWQGVMGAAWAYAIAVLAQRVALHRVLHEAIGVGARDLMRANGPPLTLAMLTLMAGGALRGTMPMIWEAALLALAWLVIGARLVRAG
jgi:teichuronic acid exporter